MRDLIERERRDRPTTLNELFDAQGHYRSNGAGATARRLRHDERRLSAGSSHGLPAMSLPPALTPAPPRSAAKGAGVCVGSQHDALTLDT
jgi:hypothetical protein